MTTTVETPVIPTQRDDEPPYVRGDRVEVLVQYPDEPENGWAWIKGWIIDCDKPAGCRRWRCIVSVGTSQHFGYINDRVYCWGNGVGEEIRPRSAK